MRICLLNPPVTGKRHEYSEYILDLNSFPHLGMGYIAASLEQKGHRVDIIECQGQRISNRQAVKKICNEEYDLVGISAYFYNMQNVLRIVEGIKLLNPSMFIFAGGYFPTLTPEDVLHWCPGIDCCVVGEGEITCVELAEAISTGGELDSINGIAFRRDGKVINTPYRMHITDLDALPFPKRCFVSEKAKIMGLLTTRGCYGRCTFCGQKEFYDKCYSYTIRYRSPENVVQELVHLKKNYDFDKLFVHDDNFIEGSKNRKEWLNTFYNLLKSEGLSFARIRIDARANDIIACKDILIKLKEIGLTNVFVGIESFIQRQLDFFNKSTTREQNIEAIRILGEIGLELEFGFLALEPFVTMEELLENYETLKSTKYYEFTSDAQDMLSMGTRRLKAVPGTKIHEQLDEMGLIVGNEFFYDFQDPRVQLFYNILTLWNERITEYMQILYLMAKATYHKKDETLSRVRRQLYNFKVLDINLMIELCHEILDGRILEEKDSITTLNKYEEIGQPVFSTLIEFKNEMAKLD